MPSMLKKKDVVLECTISGNLKYNRVHTRKLITLQIQKANY